MTSTTVIIPIHLTKQLWSISPNQPDAKQMSYTDDPQYVWWAEDEETSLLKTEERRRQDRRGKSSPPLSLFSSFHLPHSEISVAVVHLRGIQRKRRGGEGHISKVSGDKRRIPR